MKIDLNNVEETLLIPLWGRAQLSREHNSLLNDAKALEIIEQIDYDFSKLDRRFVFRRDLWFVIRAKQFDDKIKKHTLQNTLAHPLSISARDLTQHFTASTTGRFIGTILTFPMSLKLEND